MLSVANPLQAAPVLACGALWLRPDVGPAVLSWKQVALSAVSAGVTAGVGGYLPGIPGAPVATAAVRGAIGNAATQGIAVATGLQSSFNWRGVAASAVGAGVGQAVGGAAGMNEPGFKDLSFGEQFGKRLVTGLAAGAATAVARGGRVAVQQIAVDAFGNTVGQGIVDGMQPEGASAYGYRNGADIDSDNFNPASAYGYRNGLDIESDRASTVRMRREAMYGLASEGPVRLGGPTSAEAVADWSRRIDSGIVDASENAARAQRFLDMGPVADAQAAASKFYGNVPMRSDWDDPPAPRRATDPVPGSNHAEVVRRVAAGAAREGELRLALDAQEVIDRAARERRSGLGGAVRGVGDGIEGVVTGPYHLARSIYENGVAYTLKQTAEEFLNTPSTWATAYENDDVQTLTTSALGLLLWTKGARGPRGERVVLADADGSQRIYQVGAHGDMPMPRPFGHQSHHGVNDIWLRHNFPDHDPAWLRNNAPAVLLPNAEHNATRGTFNTWRSEIAERQGVTPGHINWKSVSQGEMWALSERQFEVTRVPFELRQAYFRQFNDFINLLNRK